MARPTKASHSPSPDFHDDLYDASPPPSGQGRRARAQPSLSPSSAASISSDKENRTSRAAIEKGKGRAPMGPPRAPSPGAVRRRKRPSDMDAQGDRTRRRRTVEAEEVASDEDYDPDQDVESRRQMRNEYRELNQNLKENETDYLEPENTGLRDLLLKANDLSRKVKQTADATIDANLLLNAADLAAKRTNVLISGEHSLAIDLDDFVNKVKVFMRAGEDSDDQTATQRQRRDEDEENDGEILNWEYLGRECIKHVARPAVPGFLLGPLSVEKRAKRLVIRKAALRPNSIKETRPEVLQAGDIEKDENKNLTTLCTKILGRLRKVRQDAMAAVEAQVTEEMSEKEGDELMDKYGVSPEGGIALFKFVINPFHFGQTVENLFYVSFLIKEGKVGISTDIRGLPYLDIHEPGGGEGGGNNNSNTAKHQAVLAMDYKTWRELIDAFDIKEPMIRHREEEDQSHMGNKGWYA